MDKNELENILSDSPSSNNSEEEKDESENGVEKEDKKGKTHKEKKNWSRKLEEILFRLRNSSISYKWMHNKMASRHNLFNKIFENTLTVVDILISMSIFTTAFYCSATFELQVVTGITAALAAILHRVHSNLGLEQSSDDHKRVSIKWNELYSNIDLQLRLQYSNRSEAVTYIQVIQNMYNNLLEIAPQISPTVWKSYKDLIPESISNSLADIESNINKKEKKNTRTGKKDGGKEENSGGKKTKDIENGNDVGKKEKKEESMSKFESNKIKYEIDRFLADNVV